jgi:hypothetical protein
MKNLFKNFGNWFLNFLKTIWIMLPKPLLIAVAILFIVGWLWNFNIGTIVFLILVGTMILYVQIREFCRWINVKYFQNDEDSNKEK